jgi:hypothetical protein
MFVVSITQISKTLVLNNINNYKNIILLNLIHIVLNTPLKQANQIVLSRPLLFDIGLRCVQHALNVLALQYSPIMENIFEIKPTIPSGGVSHTLDFQKILQYLRNTSKHHVYNQCLFVIFFT